MRFYEVWSCAPVLLVVISCPKTTRTSILRARQFWTEFWTNCVSSLIIQRRDGDSNPGYGFDSVQRFSKPSPSATRPSLRRRGISYRGSAKTQGGWGAICRSSGISGLVAIQYRWNGCCCRRWDCSWGRWRRCIGRQGCPRRGCIGWGVRLCSRRRHRRR